MLVVYLQQCGIGFALEQGQVLQRLLVEGLLGLGCLIAYLSLQQSHAQYCIWTHCTLEFDRTPVNQAKDVLRLTSLQRLAEEGQQGCSLGQYAVLAASVTCCTFLGLLLM